MSIILQSSGGGSVTIAEPTTASNFTLTLPAAAGTAMVSGNMPAFSAYMTSSSQSVTASTYTKVALNAELFDTNSNYDTTNYRFTPTVAGYYQINGVLGVSWNTASSNGYIVLIYKNGSQYLSTQVRASLTYGGATISQLVYMNGSTDYLELWGYAVGGTDPVFLGSGSSPTQYYSWLSGSLVRAT
jgi:hypothetical protein